MTTPTTDNLWTIERTSQYLGVPVATLYQWRHRRTGPPVGVTASIGLAHWPHFGRSATRKFEPAKHYLELAGDAKRAGHSQRT